MKEVLVYTDGACSGNPGPGGWGAILFHREHKKEISGGEPDTTNNRMELLAAIKALELLKEQCHVKLYTDSAYLYKGFVDGWLVKWQMNGWQNSRKQPVENRDLWEKLIELAAFHAIEWYKVKGHSDNEYNNRCDTLARAAIKAQIRS